MEVTPLIGSQFEKTVIPLIENAKYDISIIIFFWRFKHVGLGSAIARFNNAIVLSARRGVRVRVLVCSDTLRNALRLQGIDARMSHSKKLLHTKMLIVDGVNVVIGSHNYTHHGFSMNEEVSVYFTTPTPANDFILYFNNLFGI